MHAFDAAEEAHEGLRSREWTAIHPTRLGVVREMARCLRLLGGLARLGLDPYALVHGAHAGANPQ